MRKLFIVAPLMFLPVIGFAGPKMPVLNQVQYQLTAEKWATTDTAKVIVSIDSTLNQVALANINQIIMSNLKKIVQKADWHITSFNRSKTQSGLETMRVIAEARIPEKQLSGLRNKAKDVTRPGSTYRIADIQFTPSPADIQNTRAALRQEIYQQVKTELTKLNAVYPGEKFQVNSINFTRMPMPRPMMKNRTMMLAAESPSAVAAPQMSVSAKVVQNATVVFAAPFKGKNPTPPPPPPHD